jgi:hypothetical protein
MKDFDSIRDNVMNSIENRVRQAYNRGYEDGRDECSYGKLKYKQGLNDAWECAKKIMLDVEDGGMSADDIIHIFDDSPYSTFKKVSASEAIEKINKFEETKDVDDWADWHDIPSDEMTEEQLRSAVKDLRKSVIENLPKKGYWEEEVKILPLSDTCVKVYRCNCCKLTVDSESKYCPLCGSKNMEG